MEKTEAERRAERHVTTRCPACRERVLLDIASRYEGVHVGQIKTCPWCGTLIEFERIEVTCIVHVEEPIEVANDKAAE